MRVVVTGGAGFLGSHLVQALLERGDDVVSVDNMSSGQLANVEMFSNNPRFTFVHADVVRGIPVHGHVDVVAHLASPASPPDYHRMPLETLAVGSRGTENALELALRHDARFVLASTSEVYGDPLVHPQVEEYFGNVNSIGRRSVYDEAKRFAEAISMAYRRTCGVNVGIFRIFNTYGPRMRPQDGRVVTSFITQALTGTPITIYGDGSQTRSFCYVDDLIRGIIGMIDSDLSGPINLGNPYERTMLELAELVLELTGSSSGLEFHPLPQDDPTRRRPDITKAQTLLGWEPVVDAEVGLARTIEYFAARPEQLVASIEAVAGPQFEGNDVTETREPNLQLSA